MTIVPVYIDVRPAYLCRTGAPPSLLLAAVGTGRVLDLVRPAVRRFNGEAPHVLTDFEPDDAYRAGWRAVESRVGAIVPLAQFEQVLATCELSDWLLIVDPRVLPAHGVELDELLRDSAGDRSARYLVALDTAARGTKEYVQVDARGRVERIQRYYDGVTRLQAQAIVAALVPVTALRECDVSGVREVAELRRVLASNGFVGRDICQDGSLLDLRSEHGLLQLCEQTVRAATARGGPPEHRELAPGIYVGAGCQIHPAARLYGPVLVQANVQIEEGATIIGPALIGIGARIERGAVLAQCLVAPETTVRAGMIGYHHLVCADGVPAEAERTDIVERIAAHLPEDDTGGEAERSRVPYRRLKRVGEGAIALLALLVLGLPLLLVALLVRLTSRGSALFSHVREGKDGKPFRCYKFRTMVANAHSLQRELYRRNEVDGPQFKLERDPRITRLGHWLRMTNIDELPQLWNVVCGQMSLIGPRPSPFRENQICVPWRRARLSVRPGITGLWQVCRRERAASDFHQWIYYDILYVRHMSLLLDLKILLATLLTFGGRWSVPVNWIIPSRALQDDADLPTAAERAASHTPAIVLDDFLRDPGLGVERT